MEPRHTKRDLEALLAARDIRPKKNLGQVFLVDHNLLRYLADAAGLTKETAVLEIGAGTGLLTRYLAERAGAVWAVEIDGRLCEIAAEYLEGLDNVSLINGDILDSKLEINREIRNIILDSLRGTPKRTFKVVSNLPYSVSSPVICSLLTGALPVDDMWLTVQKEIADRLLSRPSRKEYGSLSVIVQAAARVEVVKRLPPSVFWPRPAVCSAIVHMVPSPEALSRIGDVGFFVKTIRALFDLRRKKISNALAGSHDLGLTEAEARRALEESGIDSSARGESLDPASILSLSHAIGKIKAGCEPRSNETGARRKTSRIDRAGLR